jgi:hypothetical protein
MTGHDLLLRLAGRIPDDPLVSARRRLADGDSSAAVNGLTRWLTEEPVPLLAEELAGIRTLAADPGALPGVRPVAVLPGLPFAFSAFDPFGAVQFDAMDDAVAAVAEGYGAGGLWRAWRYRLDDPGADLATVTLTANSDDPDQVYRVYIVQASVSPALCRDLLRAVDGTGRAGTEVIALGDEPPPYQGLALVESALLWESQGEQEFDFAEVFDSVDPHRGPGFAPNHAVVEDPLEREQLLGYLRGGALVLATTAKMSDILDPAAGAVVSASFRTDGEWIWADTTEYYLSRYGLAPPVDLTAHIRRQLFRGELVPQVDDETAVRAADFLLNHPADPEEAVWFPGA